MLIKESALHDAVNQAKNLGPWKKERQNGRAVLLTFAAFTPFKSASEELLFCPK